MLRSKRIDIPATVEVRLKNAAGFVDNMMDYAREDLVGFQRPLAATFAFTAPVVVAYFYILGGLEPAIKIASSYGVIAGAGLYLIGREKWPELLATYEDKSFEKHQAKADLKCGFTESSILEMSQPPKFLEFDHGVLALADAGDFKTLFFSITKDNADPRWRAYRRGELKRRVWRWTRLPVSREIISFSALGSPVARVVPPSRISSIEAWESVNVWLGEPEDGAIIHQPFQKVATIVEQLL